MKLMSPATDYPETDGKPMAETNTHVLLIMYVHQMMKDFFARKEQKVWVASNIYWFWEEFNPDKRVSPDTMVILNADPDRKSYYSWEHESKRPEVIFEFTSYKTHRNDLGKKFRLYESLGVPEYVIFDPQEAVLDIPFQFYRLEDGKYEPVLSSEDFIYRSRLGFGMRYTGHVLKFLDLATNEVLLTPEEQREADRQEIERLRSLLHSGSASNGQHS